MDTRASQRVFRRGLGIGAAIGAIAGGPTPAFADLLTSGWRAAEVGALALGLMGAACGAVVGIACAIIPSSLLARHLNYFLRHDWLARLCAVSVVGVLLVAAAVFAAVRWHGNLTAEAIATVPLACGVILGACATGRVLRGGAVSGPRTTA